eukprot:m.73167 g.73167  ORF g.73167 m.73167 type:complete len:133 (-) comp7708_c0_seq1:60-458(-)
MLALVVLLSLGQLAAAYWPCDYNSCTNYCLDGSCCAACDSCYANCRQLVSYNSACSCSSVTLTGGAIAGIVLGSLFFVGFCLALYFWCRRRNTYRTITYTAPPTYATPIYTAPPAYTPAATTTVYTYQASTY